MGGSDLQPCVATLACFMWLTSCTEGGSAEAPPEPVPPANRVQCERTVVAQLEQYLPISLALSSRLEPIRDVELPTAEGVDHIPVAPTLALTASETTLDGTPLQGATDEERATALSTKYLALRQTWSEAHPDTPWSGVLNVAADADFPVQRLWTLLQRAQHETRTAIVTQPEPLAGSPTTEMRFRLIVDSPEPWDTTIAVAPDGWVRDAIVSLRAADSTNEAQQILNQAYERAAGSCPPAHDLRGVVSLRPQARRTVQPEELVAVFARCDCSDVSIDAVLHLASAAHLFPHREPRFFPLPLDGDGNRTMNLDASADVRRLLRAFTQMEVEEVRDNTFRLELELS